MSAIGKVFESIMNSRYKTQEYNSWNNHENQFGFKVNCRTTDVFILSSLIARQKFKKKPLFTCFVDFTKAFDYISRSALYYKLIKRSVNGKLKNIIYRMYNQATCQVTWKGSVGEEMRRAIMVYYKWQWQAHFYLVNFYIFKGLFYIMNMQLY